MTEPTPWEVRRDLIRALATLIRACTREMDLVQTGDRLGPSVTDAFIRYREARCVYLDHNTPGLRPPWA